MTLVSTMEMARDEREGFASFLDGLTQEQWNSPTLCELWAVAGSRSPTA